ncbi:MAG TPA: 1-(5-phosphoribosyl)-5-[(5-phosphoribosylamino)methylideneamino] imidazole-4-carboxamide isomerase [Steroidobacteraceae bacterium]|nr:1-(5-phosphoribosyl)-5-[(5-phosphoribosylamino)methylideneamino] imidazole-4-carboxamide isomerase [Steroidobacteraceae bacterium]
MLLIPAIDLRGGRCVRLFQGDFGAETQYAAEPEELLQRYRDLGASWLHVVDLDGARDGHGANRDILVKLAAQGVPKVQAGGGVRSLETIEALLGRGVARVVVGSAAVEEPRTVIGWLQHFGPERICLALDVRHEDGVPRVRTRGWREGGVLSLWEALAPFLGHGLKHVLCTDIARDGALAGPATALYTEGLRRHPQLHWQASGGVRDAADLAALAATGVAAAVSGKALLEERITRRELQPFLPNG